MSESGLSWRPRAAAGRGWLGMASRPGVAVFASCVWTGLLTAAWVVVSRFEIGLLLKIKLCRALKTAYHAGNTLYLWLLSQSLFLTTSLSRVCHCGSEPSGRQDQPGICLKPFWPQRAWGLVWGQRPAPRCAEPLRKETLQRKQD